MTVVWVTLAEGGIVDGASLVDYTTPDQIREWRMAGRKPMLVDFGSLPITVQMPLPDGARILDN